MHFHGEESHPKYTSMLVGKPGNHGLSNMDNKGQNNCRMPTGAPQMQPLALKAEISPSFSPQEQFQTRGWKPRVYCPRSYWSCGSYHTFLGLKFPSLKNEGLVKIDIGSVSLCALWDILCLWFYICIFLLDVGLWFNEEILEVAISLFP